MVFFVWVNCLMFKTCIQSKKKGTTTMKPCHVQRCSALAKQLSICGQAFSQFLPSSETDRCLGILKFNLQILQKFYLSLPGSWIYAIGMLSRVRSYFTTAASKSNPAYIHQNRFHNIVCASNLGFGFFCIKPC